MTLTKAEANRRLDEFIFGPAHDNNCYQALDESGTLLPPGSGCNHAPLDFFTSAEACGKLIAKMLDMGYELRFLPYQGSPVIEGGCCLDLFKFGELVMSSNYGNWIELTATRALRIIAGETVGVDGVS